MAWTTPRTWVDHETPTATLFNTHIRDNLNILKTSRDDLGRILGLSSSYVANLDGTSLTGLAQPGASNTFTTGTHNFAAAELKVPVGADKWAISGGLPAPGSIWVEGDYLHHIDASRTEWRYLGNVIAAAGAQPGFLFISSAGLRYTDESGVIRECVSSLPQHNDAAARGGSLWVDGSYMNWIQQTGAQAYQGHSDVTHADHSDHHDHTDHGDLGSPHGDTTHQDSGFPHVDHTDGPGHGDHTDHHDVAHADHTDHTDHSDHSDSTPHGDVAADSRPVLA